MALDRRSFLKLGLAGSSVLAVAGLGGLLAGCGQREQSVAAGLRFLRDADVGLLRALLPVMLQGSMAPGAAGEASLLEALRRIDDACRRLGPPAQAEVHKLFDLLHLGPMRWLATGIAAPWSEAAPEDIDGFLRRWRDSRIGLFNAGYAALNKLSCVGFFGQPAGAALSGYPGPLAWAHKSLNA